MSTVKNNMSTNLESILQLEKEQNEERLQKAREAQVFDLSITRPLIATGICADDKYILRPESDTFTRVFWRFRRCRL